MPNKLYSILVTASFFTGLGMMLGHNLGNASSNTPIWIGGILILASAVLLGVRIGSSQAQDSDADTKNI